MLDILDKISNRMGGFESPKDVLNEGHKINKDLINEKIESLMESLAELIKNDEVDDEKKEDFAEVISSIDRLKKQIEEHLK